MSAVFPVLDDVRWREHTASAGQTVFPIPYVFQDVADIAVEKISVAGVVTTLTFGTHYGLSGAGNPAGGSLILSSPALAGEKYRTIGKAVGARTTSIVRAGKYASAATDADLDRALIRDLELRREVGRALKAGYGTDPGQLVPAPGYFLRWSSDGKVENATAVSIPNETLPAVAKTFITRNAANSLYDALTAASARDLLLDDVSVSTTDFSIGKGARLAGRVTEFNMAADYGVVQNGTADDAAAMQDAIDDALSGSAPKPIVVTGPVQLDSPLIIDRLVDTKQDVFRIIGQGPRAGFYVDSAIKIFSSTLTDAEHPKSQGISWENLRFEGSNGSLAAYAFSQEFLRVQILNCYFHKMKALAGARYAQSWRFQNCTAKYWASGPFFLSQGAFDVHSVMGLYEFGAGLFAIADTDNVAAGAYGNVGCSFAHDCYEGSAGDFVLISAGQGVSLIGIYSEANSGRFLEANVLLANPSVTVLGNFIDSSVPNKADTSFYEIDWGATTRGVSIGNYCVGRLHDDTNVQVGGLIEIGDTGTLGKFRTGAPFVRQGVTVSALTSEDSLKTWVNDTGRRCTALVDANATKVWYKTVAGGRYDLGAGARSVEVERGDKLQFEYTVDPDFRYLPL